MKPYITLLVIFLIAACQTTQPRYLYVPPLEKAGQTCIQKCDTPRFTCVNAQNNKYDACLNEAQFENRVYRDCAQALDVAGTQGACRKPRPCPLPNLSSCVTAYNECYTTCGGQVVAE